MGNVPNALRRKQSLLVRQVLVADAPVVRQQLSRVEVAVRRCRVGLRPVHVDERRSVAVRLNLFSVPAQGIFKKPRQIGTNRIMGCWMATSSKGWHKQ